MKKTFFSVVTSAYNSEEYIRRSVESVINQNYDNFEYVIIDNGSNDKTFKIIKEYESKYPQIIRSLHLKQNRGISGGRNYAIQNTLGEYVCFLDADDYWDKNKLRMVDKTIHEHPEFNIFSHWEYHIKNNSKKIVEYRQTNNTDLFRDLLLNGNCLSTSAMVIKKELLVMVGGFDLKLVAGEEDYDLWLRLARNGGQIYMIKKPLGYWVIRENSVSAKHILHTEAVIKVIKKYFDILFSENQNDEIVKKKYKFNIAASYCSCGRGLSKSGNRNDAYKMFKKSISAFPLFYKSYVGIILNLFHL